MLSRRLCRILLLCALLCSTGFSSKAQTRSFVQTEIFVSPLSGEDVDGPCRYTLTLPAAHQAIRFVWLIFDRARDVHDLVADPKVLRFAAHHDVALVLQSQCPGKKPDDRGDMNMDPAAGLGPMFFRALEHFAMAGNHPELPRAHILLLGFSGAGPLAARLVGAYPDRVAAAVLSAPGHFSPHGIDTVELGPRAQQIPQLILAGGADDRSGTELPYNYFLRYRRLGAPWTFAVQNRSPHCCTANARQLMVDWLVAVLKQRGEEHTRSGPGNRLGVQDWLGSFQTEPTAIHDSFGLSTFNVARAKIRLAKGANKRDTDSASWLPNDAVARQWLAFVQQPSHPIVLLR